MLGENSERWKLLCLRASTEQDSQKLRELIKEINDLLDEKYNRVKESTATPTPADSHPNPATSIPGSTTSNPQDNSTDTPESLRHLNPTNAR